MYITHNGVNYPCACRPSATMSYHNLPDDFPVPVSGEIILCADDGFVMRTDIVENYLRQTFLDGVLTLTNVPEPVVTEEEEDTEYTPTAVEQLRADVDYIAMEMGIEL